MSTPDLDMAPDVGLNAWLTDFFRRRPIADGVPIRPGTPPPPAPLQFTPATAANTCREVVLTPVTPKPSRPIPHGWQGRFHSRKLDRTIRWKSQLVFELLQHFEADPRITDFAFRAQRLELHSAGRRTAYTPDLSAVANGTTWFIEVAWSNRVTPPVWRRLREFGEALSRDGIGFQLVTEAQIRHEPRWGNIRWILRALPSEDLPAERRLRCLERLNDSPACLDELRGLDAAFSLKELMRLTLLGDIAFDLDEPLRGSTLFRRTHRPPS